MICLNSQLPDDIPEVEDGVCCAGAAMFGPTGCTCWVKVHDLDQAEPCPGIPQVNPDGMCGDCAYRPGSPEKLGDPDHVGNAEQLEDLAASGTPFWCHQGMRRIVALQHPAGVDYPVSDPPRAYDPPLIGAVPFRADGSVGLLCAGWAARGRALAAHQADDGPVR